MVVFPIWTLLCGGYNLFDWYFVTNFVIKVNMLAVLMFVATTCLALPIVSNMFPVSYRGKVEEHVLSKYCCVWWGF